MRPKSSRSLSFGIDAVDEFAVFIETVHFRPSQCVGNDGMVFAVVERPFFAEVVATFEHFDVGVVTVVFVVGYQSVGLVVFDHNVVAVGETAQFFAVASVNGGQITVAKIDFGKQQPCAAVGGGDLVEVVWKKVISTQQPNRFLIKQTAKFEVRSNVSSCNVDKSPSFLTLIYP